MPGEYFKVASDTHLWRGNGRIRMTKATAQAGEAQEAIWFPVMLSTLPPGL